MQVFTFFAQKRKDLHVLLDMPSRNGPHHRCGSALRCLPAPASPHACHLASLLAGLWRRRGVRPHTGGKARASPRPPARARAPRRARRRQNAGGRRPASRGARRRARGASTGSGPRQAASSPRPGPRLEARRQRLEPSGLARLDFARKQVQHCPHAPFRQPRRARQAAASDQLHVPTATLSSANADAPPTLQASSGSHDVGLLWQHALILVRGACPSLARGTPE